MGDFTKEDYQAAIPACCAYQTVQEHADRLMLCWALCASLQYDHPMDCRGCDLATRPVIFSRPIEDAAS
jgi:hypothetical protein